MLVKLIYKINIIFLIYFLNIQNCFADQKLKECLNAICQQESSCKPLGCKFDVNSDSCGYYQIKLPYYNDCGTPGREKGESIDSAWKRCASDYECSTKCVENYYNRYQGKCSETMSQCEKMSRLHNGGPRGCDKVGTIKYWEGVKGKLEEKNFEKEEKNLEKEEKKKN